MHKSSKGFAHLILIIGVVLVGIVGIGYLMFKNNQISTTEEVSSVVYSTQEECEEKTGKTCDFQNCDYIPKGKTFEEVCGKDFKKGWIPTEKTTASSDTSNWKTYRSGDLGFEVMYPNYWTHEELDYSTRTEVIFSDFEFPNTEFVSILVGGIYSSELDRPLTLKERVRAIKEISNKYWSDTTLTDINIDTTIATKITYKNASGLFAGNILFENEASQFLIAFETPYDQKDKFLPTFNQILSTFRFIK